MHEIMLVTAKNHAKNMPCFEKIMKFQAKSYLNRQHSKKKKKSYIQRLIFLVLKITSYKKATLVKKN